MTESVITSAGTLASVNNQQPTPLAPTPTPQEQMILNESIGGTYPRIITNVDGSNYVVNSPNDLIRMKHDIEKNVQNRFNDARKATYNIKEPTYVGNNTYYDFNTGSTFKEGQQVVNGKAYDTYQSANPNTWASAQEIQQYKNDLSQIKSAQQTAGIYYKSNGEPIVSGLSPGVYSPSYQVYAGVKTREYIASDIASNPNLVRNYQPVTTRTYSPEEQINNVLGKPAPSPTATPLSSVPAGANFLTQENGKPKYYEVSYTKKEPDYSSTPAWFYANARAWEQSKDGLFAKTDQYLLSHGYSAVPEVFRVTGEGFNWLGSKFREVGTYQYNAATQASYARTPKNDFIRTSAVLSGIGLQAEGSLLQSGSGVFTFTATKLEKPVETSIEAGSLYFGGYAFGAINEGAVLTEQALINGGRLAKVGGYTIKTARIGTGVALTGIYAAGKGVEYANAPTPQAKTETLLQTGEEVTLFGKGAKQGEYAANTAKDAYLHSIGKNPDYVSSKPPVPAITKPKYVETVYNARQRYTTSGEDLNSPPVAPRGKVTTTYEGKWAGAKGFFNPERVTTTVTETPEGTLIRVTEGKNERIVTRQEKGASFATTEYYKNGKIVWKGNVRPLDTVRATYEPLGREKQASAEKQPTQSLVYQASRVKGTYTVKAGEYEGFGIADSLAKAETRASNVQEEVFRSDIRTGKRQPYEWVKADTAYRSAVAETIEHGIINKATKDVPYDFVRMDTLQGERQGKVEVNKNGKKFVNEIVFSQNAPQPENPTVNINSDLSVTRERIVTGKTSTGGIRSKVERTQSFRVVLAEPPQPKTGFFSRLVKNWELAERQEAINRGKSGYTPKKVERSTMSVKDLMKKIDRENNNRLEKIQATKQEKENARQVAQLDRLFSGEKQKVNPLTTEVQPVEFSLIKNEAPAKTAKTIPLLNTGGNTNEGTSTSPRTKSIVSTSSLPDTTQNNTTSTVYNIGSVVGIKARNDIRTKQNQQQNTESVTMLGVEPLSATKTRQDTQVETLGVSELFTTGGLQSKPSFKINTPEVPPVIITEVPKFYEKNAKGTGSYKVSVKRGGKFSIVGAGLSLADAFKRGENIVENTAAASFKITPEGDESVNSSGFLPLGKYYQSKSSENTFVQKARYRISSFGEKQEITYKGIQVSRFKKKTGGLRL